jgi:hypothetical protein
MASNRPTRSSVRAVSQRSLERERSSTQPPCGLERGRALHDSLQPCHAFFPSGLRLSKLLHNGFQSSDPFLGASLRLSQPLHSDRELSDAFLRPHLGFDQLPQAFFCSRLSRGQLGEGIAHSLVALADSLDGFAQRAGMISERSFHLLRDELFDGADHEIGHLLSQCRLKVLAQLFSSFRFHVLLHWPCPFGKIVSRPAQARHRVVGVSHWLSAYPLRMRAAPIAL